MPRQRQPADQAKHGRFTLGSLVAQRVRAMDGNRPNEEMGLLAWGQCYLPKHFGLPPSKLHLWAGARMDEMRRRRGVKINLLGPRGSAKSTVCTLCHVLRSVLEDLEPYVWIVSDTKGQAQTHLDNLRTELERNPHLAADYAGVAGRGPRWSATSIELRNGCVIESFGTGQRIRGRRRGEHRPSLIVCDDIQSDSHMVSRLQRDASRRWFYGTLLKSGTPRTNIVNLATALHRDALAVQLHEAPGWTTSLFRSIQRWPRRMDLWSQWEQIYCEAGNASAQSEALAFFRGRRTAMLEGVEVLWPEQEDLYALMTMRAESGHTAFEREKQNSPIDPERCEWPEEYFGDHIWFDHWPSKLRLRAMALDPSKGVDARYGDFSAFVMLGVCADGRLYVDADLAKRPTPQIVADGATLCEQFRPDAFGIETNQFQELLAAEFASEFRRRGRGVLHPVALNNHTNKAMRIRRLGPYLSQQRIHFRAGSPSARLVVEQLRDFPVAEHDDGPDALEMALRLAEDWFHHAAPSDGLGARLPVDQ